MSDTLILSPSVEFSKQLASSFSDSLSISDFVDSRRSTNYLFYLLTSRPLTRLFRTLALSDSVNLSDISNFVKSISYLFYLITSRPSIRLSKTASLADSATLSDSISVVRSPVTVVSDSLSLTAAYLYPSIAYAKLFAHIQSGLSGQVTDSLNIVDNVTVKRLIYGVSDSLKITDTIIVKSLITNVQIADSIVLSADTIIVKSQITSVQVADSIVLSVTASAAKQ